MIRKSESPRIIGKIMILAAVLSWCQTSLAAKASHPTKVAVAAKDQAVGEGRMSKNGVIVPLPKGYALWDLSRIYEVPVQKIIEANQGGRTNLNRLKVGMEILIPGATEVRPLVKRGKKAAPPCFKPAVTLYRVQNNESVEASLCYCSGKPNPEALDKVSRLARYLPKNKVKKLNPHLLEMLQAVADKYPKRRIEIISGYRMKKQPTSESRHTTGRAVDFRVEGVKYATLRDFVRKFKDAGVGYYPNSVFVHLDVRDPGKGAFWCDYSRPGEPALYAPMGLSKDQVALLRTERYGVPAETPSPAETLAGEKIALNLAVAGDRKDAVPTEPETRNGTIETKADVPVEPSPESAPSTETHAATAASATDGKPAQGAISSPGRAGAVNPS